MTIVQSLLLGIVQGLTEFLPVSSSGHLVVMKNLFGVTEVPVLFDVLLHVATLGVVVIVFRKRIGALLLSCVRWIGRRSTPDDAENLRLSWVILVATFITGALGLALGSLEVGRFPKIVGGLFIVTAIVLVAVRSARGTADYSRIGLRHALFAGIGQSLGVLPGISRSGITISAALVSGVKRERAGEFSFLLSIPAILGALLVTLRDAGALAATVSAPALVVGIAASFAAGWAALVVLLWLVRSARLYLFAFYLVPLGVASLLFL